jgi:Ca-activated chloride channel family protein
VEAVVVPVTVRTHAGRIVDRLPATRFHLFVDGMEFPIEDVARESELPVSLGFVLDTSGSMGGHKFREACRLILAFLDQRRPGDEVALWTFGDNQVRERFPFGSDWYVLPRMLESITPWSTTALYDMVRRAPEVMAGARNVRRAVILLTDGVDNASQLTHAEIADLVQQLETPIYVIGVEPSPEAVEPDGPTFEEVLQRIAEGSGGRYERVPQADRMAEVAEGLLQELGSRFILSFETSGVGVAKYRRLEVRVDGYDASTREGYVGTLP